MTSVRGDTMTTFDGTNGGPFLWRVLWGSIARPGFTQEIVEAYDVDEALQLAHERRPDLFRPRVAFLVGGLPTPLADATEA